MSAVLRPGSQHAWLLNAALASGETARAAWAAWRREGDLDRLDAASYRLLPQLFVNLTDHGIDDPDLGRLRGVHRMSWYRNQILFDRSADALRVLEERGVPTLVLKGAALAVLDYRDRGARPMDDVDVAVPPSAAQRAIGLFRRMGWTPELEPTPQLLRGRHSLGFLDAEGHGLDLHWRIFWQAGADQPLWAAARPLTLGGVATRALAPADQLLHVCAHGVSWNPVPPFRWLADAHTVIGRQAIDWERLIDQAAERRLSLAMADALGLLRDLLGTPVPEDALVALGSVRFGRFERWAQGRLAQPPSARRSMAVTWLLWDRFRRQARVDRSRADPVEFLRSLQGLWGLGSLNEVPAQGLRRLARHGHVRIVGRAGLAGGEALIGSKGVSGDHGSPSPTRLSGSARRC